MIMSKVSKKKDSNVIEKYGSAKVLEARQMLRQINLASWHFEVIQQQDQYLPIVQELLPSPSLKIIVSKIVQIMDFHISRKI